MTVDVSIPDLRSLEGIWRAVNTEFIAYGPAVRTLAEGDDVRRSNETRQSGMYRLYADRGGDCGDLECMWAHSS